MISESGKFQERNEMNLDDVLKPEETHLDWMVRDGLFEEVMFERRNPRKE